jgi:UDP-GlcNAc:undecaprenyl-phosphate GlcNAc-1-phosphate transferase
MRETVSLAPDRAPFAAFAIVFGVAFGLSLALTPLARWLGLRLGLVDQPRGRRQHKGNIPRTGGIAVYLAFVAAVLVAQALPVERFDPKEIIRLVGLLLGGTLIFLVGLYDDWRELSPLALYISQVLAGATAIAFLILIEYVNNPFTGQQTPDFTYPVTITITLFWLGLMMNTVNFLDGLDGLASGVAAIAGVLLFINAAFRLDPPQYSVALLPIALVGATLGLLPFNFAPARVFLGSGAYFLGFVLGVLSIIGGAKMATILLVMGLPLLDLAWQALRRVRVGQNPMLGDRGHLHFRLLDIGLPQQVVVLGYYIFCAGFGALSLLVSSRLYKLIALVAMGILAAVGFGLVARRGALSGNAEGPGTPTDD